MTCKTCLMSVRPSMRWQHFQNPKVRRPLNRRWWNLAWITGVSCSYHPPSVIALFASSHLADAYLSDVISATSLPVFKQPLKTFLFGCSLWLYQSVIGSLGHFTFWISLSLRLSLSSKFGLRPKISEKVKSVFFIWSQRLAERLAETKLRTERSLNQSLLTHRLILHAQDRLIGYRLSFDEWKSLHFFAYS